MNDRMKMNSMLDFSTIDNMNRLKIFFTNFDNMIILF